MSKENHNGRMHARRTSNRTEHLGYYLIYTDGEKTEPNYFRGIKDSLSCEERRKIEIKTNVSKNADKLVEDCLSALANSPNYYQPWIVLDKDEEQRFDEIIKEAESKDIKVGWSNPCLELWFLAYFGKNPTNMDSRKCCSMFEKEYKKVIGKEYKKNDPDIYKKLKEYGNETRAVNVAEKRFNELVADGITKPSEMESATTLFQFIKEINSL